ncbi:hypothetical protein MCHI_003387 [Candidatus Magnetoovum chiemensis]|nr:hypothetical protein MCHI_003387 [Candidatus Magnetoovum chiemensis]
MAQIKKKDLKNFSLIWAIILLVLSLYPILKGAELRIWTLCFSAAFVLIAFIKPQIIAGFYRLWLRIGEFIASIITRIIMFILFYGLFTASAFVLRILGKDLLSKKLYKNSSTYWKERADAPNSMKRQF